MLNTNQNQTAQTTPYIFIEDSYESNYSNKVLVAKKAWFEPTPQCQTYNSYGYICSNEMDGEHNGVDCCESVQSYDLERLKSSIRDR